MPSQSPERKYQIGAVTAESESPFCFTPSENSVASVAVIGTDAKGLLTKSGDSTQNPPRGVDECNRDLSPTGTALDHAQLQT